MSDKDPKELHLRVSPGCFEKLQTIAQDDELPIAAVCRHALWQYVRQRLADAGNKSKSD